MKYTLISEDGPNGKKVIIELDNISSIADVLATVRDFLRASGFSYIKEIEAVDSIEEHTIASSLDA